MDAPQAVCEYACALIVEGDALLLELRPAQARIAAGQCTCFGGACEPGEQPETALRRELREELGWQLPADPSLLQPALDLLKGPRWVARFFTVRNPVPRPTRHLIPGFRALWVPWASLPGIPLSPWHATVLKAWQRGEQRVQLLPPSV
ncbi:MAG: NUDIX domain-containing protein [Planctomycetota bacterium]|nr:MAG: NUDIX domain-containing protein [Planctomycetota bacterium]